jgi:hypothetical protein
MRYRPDVDYRRKRGVLESINRAVMQVEAEATELRDWEKRQVTFPDGEIEYLDEGGDFNDPDAKDTEPDTGGEGGN